MSPAAVNRLAHLRTALRLFAAPPVPAEINEELLETLRALGYAE